MRIIDLNNDLTLHLVEVRHSLYPHDILCIILSLQPAIGVVYNAPSDSGKTWGFIWDSATDREGEAATAQMYIGKSTSDIVTAITAQWTTYISDNPVDRQLTILFDYVKAIGIKQ